MLDIIVIVIIFIFGFIFIDQLRVHEGMKSLKSIVKSVKSKAKSALNSAKSVSKLATKSVKSESKDALKKVKSKAKDTLKKINSDSIIKLTNQLIQYKANLAASAKNERALMGAINIAGSIIQSVNNDMGTVSGTISSVLNINRVKQPYVPFRI